MTLDNPLAGAELCSEMRFLSHESLRVVLINANQQLLKVATVSQGFRGPVHWNHINLTDDYSWRQNEHVENGGFRPFRFPPPRLNVQFFHLV